MSTRQHTVLIVEDDVTTLRQLEVNLRRFGYQIVSTRSSKEALELADKHQPDLVISSIILPEMDGIELCWNLRVSSQVPQVPIILLTQSDDPEVRINGYRSGADAFLSKPVSVRELITRVETLLRRIEQLGDHFRRRWTLAGDLQEFGLVDLVQFLHMSRKTGVLRLHTESTGELGFREGELIAAKSENRTGIEALREMIGWSSGSFEFDPRGVIKTRNIRKQTMQILLELTTWADEQATGQQD